MKRLLSTVAIAISLSGPALADGSTVISQAFDGAFDDATFALESAILDKGLVIDSVSHVGDMLARTGEDVGGTVKIFDAADVYSFCSAQLSRQVMEADPMNIAHCPYRIFVADRDGAVSIGYLSMPEGPMKVIEDFLAEIVSAASE